MRRTTRCARDASTSLSSWRRTRRGTSPRTDSSGSTCSTTPIASCSLSATGLAGSRVVDLEDLAADEWVAAVGVNGLGRDETIAICRRAGFTPRFAAQAVEFPAAQAYVATGIGVGLVPALALGTVHEGVVVRPIRNEPEPRHVWALTRPSLVDHVPVAQTLRALRKAAADQRRIASASSR